MFACWWLFSVCLVGQVSRIPPPPIDIPPPATSPAKSISGDENRSTGFSRKSVDKPVRSWESHWGESPRIIRPAVTSDQLVADALALPIDGSITGRPISLLSAVAAVPDRARQLEAVHAYWRLVEATGDRQGECIRSQLIRRCLGVWLSQLDVFPRERVQCRRSIGSRRYWLTWPTQDEIHQQSEYRCQTDRQNSIFAAGRLFYIFGWAESTER